MSTQNPGERGYHRVVVSVDDSVGGPAALRRAVDMASAGGSPLPAVRSWGLGLPRHGGCRRRRQRGDRGHLVMPYNGAGQRDQVPTLVGRAFGDATGGVPKRVAVTTTPPGGNPGRVVTDLANRDGDVLVVGTGPERSPGRLVHGSVSHCCRQHARCQVEVIPPADAAPATDRQHGHN